MHAHVCITASTANDNLFQRCFLFLISEIRNNCISSQFIPKRFFRTPMSDVLETTQKLTLRNMFNRLKCVILRVNFVQCMRSNDF